jgi:hypothetical protein
MDALCRREVGLPHGLARAEGIPGVNFAFINIPSEYVAFLSGAAMSDGPPVDSGLSRSGMSEELVP